MTMTLDRSSVGQIPGITSILAELAHRGVIIGIPRSVALEHHAVVPAFEIEVRREDIPTEEALRAIIEQTRAQILWRITIDDLHIQRTFNEADWQLFISLLVSARPGQHVVQIALDRSIEYDTAILDMLEAFHDVAAIPVFLDAEHSSWKTLPVQSILKSLRLPHVYIDGPQLPGIVKDASYITGETAILRCVGRNSRSWFEHGHERYTYRYLPEEIDQVAERILRLRDAMDTVYVIMHNRPSTTALNNLRELAQALIQKQ